MLEINNISNITNPYSRIKLDYEDGELLKIKLVWDSCANLDLCAFFLAKDVTVGGVFPSDYNNRREASGSLNTFPYMLYIEECDYYDEDIDKNQDQIWITNLFQIDKVCFIAIDYDAAINEIDAKFSEDKAKLLINNELKTIFQTELYSSSKGCVYSIYSTVNETDGLYICNHNDNLVMDLATAFGLIPGFSTICNYY